MAVETLALLRSVEVAGCQGGSWQALRVGWMNQQSIQRGASKAPSEPLYHTSIINELESPETLQNQQCMYQGGGYCHCLGSQQLLLACLTQERLPHSHPADCPHEAAAQRESGCGAHQCGVRGACGPAGPAAHRVWAGEWGQGAVLAACDWADLENFLAMRQRAATWVQHHTSTRRRSTLPPCDTGAAAPDASRCPNPPAQDWDPTDLTRFNKDELHHSPQVDAR